MIAAGGFAAVGLGLGLWPLLDMMNPDQSALSMATTEVDLAPVAEGQAITVMWRGKPIFIRHRTKKEIEEAQAVPIDDLPDPLARNANLPEDAPATDENRAEKNREPWLVMIGICTHLGCIPKGQAIGDPKGARAAEHGNPALCLPLRHQGQDRLADGHGALIFFIRAIDRHRKMDR
jgi:ubiquinol-cytochrome c reductase iron-sulfur subunit